MAGNETGRSEGEADIRSTRRERMGWYFYDFANSAFSTTVVTVFLGPYLTAVARAAADSSGRLPFLGFRIVPGAYYPFLVSISVLLQVLFLPFLGALADYTHRKKQMLFAFAYLGAFSTLALYLTGERGYISGGLLFVVANLSFGASVVFYNAYLPELAGPDERDAVSSAGWALGYLGGGFLLALNLLLLRKAGDLGLSQLQAVRISLASAGGWWALFSFVPMATLRTRGRGSAVRLPPRERLTTAGFRQLVDTFRQIRRYPQTLWFLAAALLYNDGIQTVIALSSQFGQEELGLPVSTLTAAILMVQFVAFFGAFFFGRLARFTGTRRAIAASLVVWIVILLYAWAGLHDAGGFFLLAAATAVVLGGSQALTRSAYSLLIPREKESEYFGLYEVSERGTSWLGPLLFGIALEVTGSYRTAILSLAVFFVAGLLLLSKVDLRRGAMEAGNEPPSRG